MKRTNIIIKGIGLNALLLLFVLTGCKKMLAVDAPETSTNGANVYTTDATAAAVLTGIYTRLSVANSTGFANGTDLTSMSLFLSLSADELTLSDPNNLTYFSYYRNVLTSNPPAGTADYWGTIYPAIFIANAAIEGLTNATTLSEPVKQQLLGEAKFIRAFCYFYLVNFYGDVPLTTGTDYIVNAALPRTPKDEVWKLIINDLKDAENQLSSNYLKSDVLAATTERVRPTKWAAKALLARAYLYTNDYVNAEMEATDVINNTALFSMPALNNAFLKNSGETIWALQPVKNGTNSNTGEGKIFILPAAGPGAVFYPVYLDNDFVNSFEAGDQRKTSWINSVTASGVTYYYPYKYKIGAVNTSVSEYIMVLRLAEQYLIRAEARAQRGDLSGAASDIDVVRTRAGLLNTTAATKDDLLIAIMKERRSEFFTEWGNRWLDLKRTNTIDAVMTPATAAKGGSWQPTDQLFPILLSQLRLSPQLLQNAGY